MADLSHWDFADAFSAIETAALIIGSDPSLEILGEKVTYPKSTPILKKLSESYHAAWGYWHTRSDGCFELNDSVSLPDEAIQSAEMIEFQGRIHGKEITQNMAQYIGSFIGNGSSQNGEYSAFHLQRFPRTEVIRWLTATGMKSVYQFDLRQHLAESPTIAQTDPDIDPADLPIELDAANMAYRAVLNGYGNQSDTFKNRLIDYLQTTYTDLKTEAVQRIATVANPDKATGRKRLSKE